VEQAFGILVSRFGILWKSVRFNLRKMSVIHTCMVLHNFCVENCAPWMEIAMTQAEKQRTEQAFGAWGAAGTEGVSDQTQGRRRDLDSCEVLDALTQQLKDLGLLRPA
jgi:hypothetical protein